MNGHIGPEEASAGCPLNIALCSDRWLRITMYKGAPFPDELGALDPDDLFYPQLADGTAPQ